MLKWLLVPLVLAGCRDAASAQRISRATLSGRAQYRDADTDAENTHRDPNAPVGQRGSVRVVLHGTGALDADCPDAAAGRFVARYDGDFSVDSSGEFSAPLYPASPPIATPSGCAVRGVDTAQIGDVEITAAIAASSSSCGQLCDGLARQASRDRCAGSAASYDCRSAIEPALDQPCDRTCRQRAAAIVGHGALEGTTITAAHGDDLATGNLGDLHARLLFEQMVDPQQRAIE